MHRIDARKWLILWIYLLVFGHFVAGVFLAWFGKLNVFAAYHHTILGQLNDASAGALQLQYWWVSLFGATLQSLAIFMAVLTYVASKRRIAGVWVGMMFGLIVWAPQDMLISLQINLWLHVWIDALALVLLVPPLLILYRIDRRLS